MRIISLVPSQTELLYYLLPPEQIVGITRFCIHPRTQYKTTPKIGGTKDFDFDVIDALHPDLIIGNKEENYKEGIERLQQKYRVWISDIESVEDAVAMLRKVGELVHQETKAHLLSDEIENKWQKLEQTFSHEQPLKAAYFIWNKPYMVAGRNNYINDVMGKLGFQNVFTRADSRYPDITEEALKVSDPDCIMLSSEPYHFKQRHIEHFKSLCPNAAVYLVNGEMFSWYGSRMLEAVDYLTEFRRAVNV